MFDECLQKALFGKELGARPTDIGPEHCGADERRLCSSYPKDPTVLKTLRRWKETILGLFGPCPKRLLAPSLIDFRGKTGIRALYQAIGIPR